MDNIDRTLLCKAFYLSYDAFECPTCHNENLLFCHCHSRFCNSCGVKQQKLISSKVAEMAVDAPHRHIVFTIPEEIRDFFRIDRDAMNLLFIVARNTICLIFNDKIYKKAKKKNLPNSYYLYRHFRHQKEFGMIACLHTFGRDLKWNPHIHALVPEITYDPEAHTVKPFTHLNFEKLRRTFQYEFLRLMTEHFEKRFNIFKKFKKYNKFKRFREIKEELYNNHFKGFYAYAKYTKYDTSETKVKRLITLKELKLKLTTLCVMPLDLQWLKADSFLSIEKRTQLYGFTIGTKIINV